MRECVRGKGRRIHLYPRAWRSDQCRAHRPVAVTGTTACSAGEAAVSNGWLHRAQRLLEGLESTREYGWLRYRQAEAALFGEHDPESAREHAAVCRAIGRAQQYIDLDMAALALEGLAFVTAGNPAAGRRCLDEAMTAIIGGELSDLPLIGQTSCRL